MSKIPVGILGATGVVGQKFVHLLQNHPWFEIVALAASDRSQGKRYGDIIAEPISNSLRDMVLAPCLPNLPCQLVFSALDGQVAYKIEQDFAQAGYFVISNASSHRMEPGTPLLIPEVNPTHLQLIQNKRGGIITNPNCSVVALSMALKPLIDLWGVESVHIVTLQAISGAGYPGVPSLDILDNVLPYIPQEEHKIETEPLKILGTYVDGEILPHPLHISAQCTRVPVSDGHMGCISIRLKKPASRSSLIQAWTTFQGQLHHLGLPTAPAHPLVYLEHDTHPQPKLHRHAGKGMTISLGRLRPCPLLDWKFVILSHNAIRGAAGCAILNAELFVAQGYLQTTHSLASCFL